MTFVMSSLVLVVCAIVMVPSISILKYSRGVLNSPVGVIINEHSVWEID